MNEHLPNKPKPFTAEERKRIASILGSVGGSKTSAAKRRAARENWKRAVEAIKAKKKTLREA